MSAISIDGPTASGKTTLGVALASRLGCAFLDTGLTYRAVAYALSVEHLDPATTALDTVVRHEPWFSGDDRGSDGGESSTERVFYRDQDISSAIFDAALEPTLKAVAGNHLWRSQILELHRAILGRVARQAQQRVVAVGRDVAATLLRDGDLHVYLTASRSVRRERRRAQCLGSAGRSSSVGPETALDLQMRAFVAERVNSVVLDSTYLPAHAVLAAVERRLSRLAA
jgi:cytidylate kinase